MEVLQRSELVTTDWTDNELLAIKAEQMLNYSAMAEELNLPGLLGLTLIKLDIQPYSTESVEKHKDLVREQYKDQINMALQCHRHPLDWKMIPIEKACNVPVHVLSTAIHIKEAIKDVGLYIEYFESDPFLVAKLGRETYYIDSWDAEDNAR